MKEKALLEARKAGTVAPEKDADGNDINPHIPAYIANAPWYLNATAPGLQHQKSSLAKQPSEKTWYTRGATQVRSKRLSHVNCVRLHKQKKGSRSDKVS